MRYVVQENELGCFVAAIAMVLDLTYAEVEPVIPPASWLDYNTPGPHESERLAYERLPGFALAHGWVVIDLENLIVQPGLRYVAAIPGPIPNSRHAVAIDETGIVFDPGPLNENVRKHYSEYAILGLLEFARSISARQREIDELAKAGDIAGLREYAYKFRAQSRRRKAGEPASGFARRKGA
jgi:hypothetical protein